jgi:flagellin-like hook-associated protein FlgL
MSRVSFGKMVSNAVDHSRLNSNRLLDLQRQLATGKKIDRASEDPETATRSHRIRTKIRHDEQLVRSIDQNARLISEAETFMATTIDQLHRVRTLAVQASNGTLVTADMALIATEINQQLEGMLRTGNARSGGRSLFAGAETDRDAFTATRNAAGEITSVAYAGDDVELEIEARGRVPVSWPGERVFSAGSTILTSTGATWDGSTLASHADRELAAAFLPSSGVMEGSLRINDVLIGYDLDGSPSSGEGDSLLDLARKITSSGAGVRAEVTGAMQGTGGVGPPHGDFGTLLPLFTAGSFELNGETINVSGNDTLFSLSDRINSLSSATGVTAEVFDSAGERIDGTPALASATFPLFLRLNGGVEISDDTTGDTNIMQLLGMTTSPPNPTGSNLVGTVLENYAIELTGDQPGPFRIEDASGSLAADLGLTSAAAVTQGGSVFDVLINMRDRLRAGDTAAIGATVIGEIDDALSSVEVYRTEAGVRENRLTLQKNRLEEILFNQKKLLSDAEDVDLAEVISELRTQQNTQTAALRAISDVLGLSLLNFLG